MLRRLVVAADHPRIRGEHETLLESRLNLVGSSPHTRGAHQERSRGGHQCGIIPAYAGSTSHEGLDDAAVEDHPRIRGEHFHIFQHVAGRQGSSPHTRGAPDNSKGVDSSNRIIPAYAGSTKNIRRGNYSSWDHPRIRGEHPVAERRGGAYRGSSPHTRGAPTRTRRPDSQRRIIPAYAGSTRSTIAAESSPTDHPRIRGEHKDAYRAIARAAGSSPHTRGALSRSSHSRTGGGIIPAYAGSTRARLVGAVSRSDHPRIRGEHAHVDGMNWLMPGSSPHTRGAL